MIEPPDLDSPFANDSERARALADFLDACVAIEMWSEHAVKPDGIPEELREVLRVDLTSGDTPESKLQRWANIFSDEIRAVLDARNRLVHGIRLTDKEIRGANWLAHRLLRVVQSQSAA